ncbi:hypothetical protein MRX96_045915 [Rhipicephalus microplus]
MIVVISEQCAIDAGNAATWHERGTASSRALLHHAVLCRAAGVAEKFPQLAKMVAGSGHQYPRVSDGDGVYARRRATSSCELAAAAHSEGLEHDAARGRYNIHHHR